MFHDEDTIQEINKFMFSVFPDHETCKYVIKFLAICLTGYADDQLFHFGYGSGSNGKGILIKLMLETLGIYGGTLAASFLTGRTPDADAPTPALTNIVNKRFVAISETVEGAKINEQLFKSMCGQDKLVYRPMRQEAIEFEPDFKLFMVCNDLPEFKGSDYAMKRRIRVIPFKSLFKDKPDASKEEKQLDKTLRPTAGAVGAGGRSLTLFPLQTRPGPRRRSCLKSIRG
jgi:P4 family phage/plasmid primase-like protien